MTAPARDLAGRTFLVTGANTGIGRVTATVLAGRGGRVFVAGRAEAKLAPVVDAIRAAGGSAEPLLLDLADLASVRAAADRFLALGEPLHVLINNAGLAGGRGITRDGFELAFGTNHLGHFLFTLLLLPHLGASAPARIVNVSSKSHYRARGIDEAALRRPTASYTGLPEYAVSKLCNVLFTKELARGRAGAGVHSHSLHPGVVASDVWRRVPWPFRQILRLRMISTEEGALTSLYCATSPEVAEHDGRYYDRSAEKAPNPLADDVELARWLWAKSEEMVAPFLPAEAI